MVPLAVIFVTPVNAPLANDAVPSVMVPLAVIFVTPVNAPLANDAVPSVMVPLAVISPRTSKLALIVVSVVMSKEPPTSSKRPPAVTILSRDVIVRLPLLYETSLKSVNELAPLPPTLVPFHFNVPPTLYNLSVVVDGAVICSNLTGQFSIYNESLLSPPAIVIPEEETIWIATVLSNPESSFIPPAVDAILIESYMVEFVFNNFIYLEPTELYGSILIYRSPAVFPILIAESSLTVILMPPAVEFISIESAVVPCGHSNYCQVALSEVPSEPHCTPEAETLVEEKPPK